MSADFDYLRQRALEAMDRQGFTAPKQSIGQLRDELRERGPWISTEEVKEAGYDITDFSVAADRLTGKLINYKRDGYYPRLQRCSMTLPPTPLPADPNLPTAIPYKEPGA